MKYSWIIAAAGLMPLTAVSQPFSTNIGYTTDYIYRGISQTSEEPAVQGGFDFKHGTGWYLGTWASSLNFQDDSGAHVEFDVYGGYRIAAGGAGYDFGILYYSYPGAASSLDYDFIEAYAHTSYGWQYVDWTAGLHISPDFFGGVGPGVYGFLSAVLPLGERMNLAADIGRQLLDDALDYTHWSLGAGLDVQGFSLDLTYHNTDLAGEPLADARLVMTARRSF
ncbi:TorF family putative porin [Alkalilimnicola ehrlichii]|uniref:TorF family putative porin n=2 Tax=Alkalilimnicola ehrlichii TaxID=351052 RepID=UPI0015F24B18|nr:TorF family putative porin [Alkalilimnicola ehrlichii]